MAETSIYKENTVDDEALKKHSQIFVLTYPLHSVIKHNFNRKSCQENV